MTPSDTNQYILVRVECDFVDAVGICQEIERDLPGLPRAMLVRRGSAWMEQGHAYVGEFYSTPQAIERVMT